MGCCCQGRGISRSCMPFQTPIPASLQLLGPQGLGLGAAATPCRLGSVEHETCTAWRWF